MNHLYEIKNSKNVILFFILHRGKWENGSWLQWGALQGRFESFNEGVQDRSEYLQVRGVKERSWAPHSYEGLRRSFTITAAARDGTAVVLRGVSHHKVLTQ